MSTGGADEEFEFLLNLLASDGAGLDLDPPRGATDSRKGDNDDRGFGIQRGPDGKLDLGQVKAFYESKKMRVGKEAEKGIGRGVGVTGDPGSTDHSQNRPGSSTVLSRLNLELALYCAFVVRIHPMSCGLQGLN